MGECIDVSSIFVIRPETPASRLFSGYVPPGSPGGHGGGRKPGDAPGHGRGRGCR